jgi:uncharacterized protein
MWQFIAQRILRNRIGIILGIVALTGVFLYFAATNLKLDNKYGNMLPKDSPAQRDYLKFKSLFGEDGGTLVFAIQDNDLYQPEKIELWRELGQRIDSVPGVTNVISEANLIRLINDTVNKKFIVETIMGDKEFNAEAGKELEKTIRENPLYEGVIFNSEANVSLMLISVDEEFLSDPKRAKVVLHIEEIASEYEQHFGQIRFAGLPHIRVVIAKRIMDEMYIFIGLAILVTSILIFIFFRSLRIVVICNIVVFIAVIWSLGYHRHVWFQLVHTHGFDSAFDDCDWNSELHFPDDEIPPRNCGTWQQNESHSTHYCEDWKRNIFNQPHHCSRFLYIHFHQFRKTDSVWYYCLDKHHGFVHFVDYHHSDFGFME